MARKIDQRAGFPRQAIGKRARQIARAAVLNCTHALPKAPHRRNVACQSCIWLAARQVFDREMR
jgi:hypothetical protein